MSVRSAESVWPQPYRVLRIVEEGNRDRASSPHCAAVHAYFPLLRSSRNAWVAGPDPAETRKASHLTAIADTGET